MVLGYINFSAITNVVEMMYTYLMLGRCIFSFSVFKVFLRRPEDVSHAVG